MSNTDWYAALEQLKPWASFNEYASVVSKTVGYAKSAQVTPKAPTLNDFDLESVANECAALLATMPRAIRSGRAFQGCAGLPRAYPRMWMKRAHSNSLMFEFHELQSVPSNGLKSWKE